MGLYLQSSHGRFGTDPVGKLATVNLVGAGHARDQGEQKLSRGQNVAGMARS